MSRAKVPLNDRAREIVVLAFAHAIMEDLLTDWALNFTPLQFPKSLRQVDTETDINVPDLGNRFEETFLQGNAEQWSIAFDPVAGLAVREDAERLVSKWLRDL